MINIDLLGFLKDIKNDTDRKIQEQQLFESVKELIVEFVEFLLSNSDVNNQTNYNTAHLIAKLGLSDQISYTDQGQAHEKIINTALHTLKEQYKLTKKQISLLMKIICDIRPSIVQDVCLESPEQLYEKKETMIHQEKPHYNKCYKPSTKVVIKKYMMKSKLENGIAL